MDRRDWLRSTSLLAASGLVLGRPAAALTSGPDGAPTLPARGADGRARLAYNENPYGPPASARDAMGRFWDESNRYATPGVGELRALAAATWGVPESHVLVTQGSSEGLCATAAAFAGRGEVIGATPTYDRLLTYSEAAGSKVIRVPLDADLREDLAGMERAVSPWTRLAFVCNPSNPTGTLLPADAVEAFARRVSPRAPVFVDEAYFEYVDVPGHRSMMPLAVQGLDVIVSRTASKIHGMAGLRVGFLVARPDILERVARYTMGFPNTLAVRGVMAAMRDTAAQAFVRRQNAAAREVVYRALDQLGRRYVRSQGNMVFFHTGRPIAEVAKAFADRGVDVGRPFPPMLDWCRVSTGLPEEMERFVTALRGVMA